jgi:PD-(D/E)XK nuclease superfamily protein
MRTIAGMVYLQSYSTKPLYPSHLKQFLDCRRSYELRHVERFKVEEASSIALVKGNVTHAVLELCMNDLVHRRALPVPARIKSAVESRLPASSFDSHGGWQNAVDEIVAWVKFGCSYVPANAKLVAIEHFGRRMFRSDSDSFTLGAKTDLVLLHPDCLTHRGWSENPQPTDVPLNGGPTNRILHIDAALCTEEDIGPWFEIVDWKTGKGGYENPFSPVMARFVLKQIIAQYSSDSSRSRVVHTLVYLNEQRYERTLLDLQSLEGQWREVLQIVEEIQTTSEFWPNPGPQCHFCPFNGNGCDAGLQTAEFDGELW